MSEDEKKELDIDWWKWYLFLELRRSHESAQNTDLSEKSRDEQHVKRTVFLEMIERIFERNGLTKSEHEELVRIRRETYPWLQKQS